jgi:hypothetical protein
MHVLLRKGCAELDPRNHFDAQLRACCSGFADRTDMIMVGNSDAG